MPGMGAFGQSASCGLRRAGLAVFVTLSSSAWAKPPQPRTAASPMTELDRYVSQPDDAFAWKTVESVAKPTHDELIVELISQRWRSSQEVNRPRWRHWLTIAVPKQVDSPTALLWIDGGSSDDSQPTGVEPRLVEVALATRSVTAAVSNVPCQPLQLAGDDRPRYEDDLLALSWKRCLETKDLSWPAQLAMAKAAVRAMDAVTAAVAAEPGGRAVSEFVVAGASKRGWTSWLTAIVDPRVIGVAPVVIDLLNIQPSMANHHQAYGFWAPALADYEREGLADLLDDPQIKPLLDLVDPYAYRARLSLPKCVINSAQDQFFTPDSSQFYFDDLPGEKLLAYFPNAGHDLSDTAAFETLAAFYAAIVGDKPLPQIDWRLTDAGAWEVRSAPAPRKATLWTATNDKARDFRFDEIGAAYHPRELQAGADGAYVGGASPPTAGATAFFVQLEFDLGAPTPLRVSTPVRVVAAEPGS